MENKENCALCGKNIEDYNQALNCLEIDEQHKVDICRECVDKILDWQKGVYAELFPTMMVKKIYRKKRP